MFTHHKAGAISGWDENKIVNQSSADVTQCYTHRTYKP